MATPMRAVWAAIFLSALRISGRERRSSAGKPVEMDLGGVGIFLCLESKGLMLPGWRARRAAMRFLTTRFSCWSRGISASLALSRAVASCNSS